MKFFKISLFLFEKSKSNTYLYLGAVLGYKRLKLIYLSSDGNYFMGNLFSYPQ